MISITLFFQIPQPATVIHENRKNRAELAEPEPDEFQDEIQFDPTISSGQLGFGDFRNTPIKLGDSRSESVQPILPENFPENFYPSVQAAGEDYYPAVQAATGKFIQEPTISINLIFPAKK